MRQRLADLKNLNQNKPIAQRMKDEGSIEKQREEESPTRRMRKGRKAETSAKRKRAMEIADQLEAKWAEIEQLDRI